jgi:hypothetical protein
MDHCADQIVEIAFEGSNNDRVAVDRDRLKIDALKWIMSKLGHKKYGDRLALDGPAGGESQLTISWQAGPPPPPPPPLKQIEFDPGPLPSRMDGEVLTRLIQLIKDRVPRAANRDATEVLSEIMGVIDAALVAHYRKAPLSVDGAQKLIERLGEAADLPFRIHAHMLRHAAGYALAARGVDTRTLQVFMGHRSIANTVVYTAVADKRIRNIWGK